MHAGSFAGFPIIDTVRPSRTGAPGVYRGPPPHGCQILTRPSLVDTSVLPRAGLGGSPSAADWFELAATRPLTLVGSGLLATEVRRVVVNRTLRGLPVDQTAVEDLLGLTAFSSLDDRIVADAEGLRHVLRAGEAIYVAAALGLAGDGGTVVLVTYDAQAQPAAPVHRLIVRGLAGLAATAGNTKCRV